MATSADPTPLIGLGWRGNERPLAERIILNYRPHQAALATAQDNGWLGPSRLGVELTRCGIHGCFRLERTGLDGYGVENTGQIWSPCKMLINLRYPSYFLFGGVVDYSLAAAEAMETDIVPSNHGTSMSFDLALPYLR